MPLRKREYERGVGSIARRCSTIETFVVVIVKVLAILQICVLRPWNLERTFISKSFVSETAAGGSHDWTVEQVLRIDTNLENVVAQEKNVMIADGNILHSVWKGIKLSIGFNVKIPDTLRVQGIDTTLLSIRKICEQGKVVNFEENKCRIQEKGLPKFLNGKLCRWFYTDKAKERSYLAGNSKSELWHRMNIILIVYGL